MREEWTDTEGPPQRYNSTVDLMEAPNQSDGGRGERYLFLTLYHTSLRVQGHRGSDDKSLWDCCTMITHIIMTRNASRSSGEY